VGELGIAQVIQHKGKCKVVSSNSSTRKEGKEEEGKEGGRREGVKERLTRSL
jgi:hypothetical protein